MSSGGVSTQHLLWTQKALSKAFTQRQAGSRPRGPPDGVVTVGGGGGGQGGVTVRVWGGDVYGTMASSPDFRYLWMGGELFLSNGNQNAIFICTLNIFYGCLFIEFCSFKSLQGKRIVLFHNVFITSHPVSYVYVSYML